MKKTIVVRVKVEDEVYEVDSCWSQESEVFCEKIAKEVKGFVEELTRIPS